MVAVSVLVTGFMTWGLTRQDGVPASIMRLVVSQSDTAPIAFSGRDSDIAISADGTHMVYQARGQELQLRPLNRFVSEPLRGSEGGRSPFFSPDGEWVGFVGGASRTLHKVSILGGPPVTLTELPDFIVGASWGSDDQIIVGRHNGGLARVSGGGGEPETLTTLDAD